jgi:SAM-dependent methyltransferase
MDSPLTDSWEQRSKKWGASLRSVLFKGAPDAMNQHIDRWHKKIIFETIKPQLALRILDVGCGYGRLTLAIAERFADAHIIGIDVSRTFVDLFREKTGRPAFIGEVNRLPNNMGLFDCILCITVLMYVDRDNIEPSLRDLLSHLTPSGSIILIEPSSSGLPFQTGFGSTSLLHRKKTMSSLPQGMVFSESEFDGTVERIGGSIVDRQRIPATTILFLPLCLVGALAPQRIAARLFLLAERLDKLLKRTPLPSIYFARVIKKGRIV